MTVLEVDIAKRLGSFSLGVSFAIERPDEIMALLGPSGCGKSMTLKCIAGIERPDSGRIVLGGRTLFDSGAHIDLPPQRRRVGYLFQSYALFPTMTVEQNVRAGAVGATREERAARAAREIAAMRLEGLERHRPAQLSGGQQQRCAMARILASDPELILLDEPFSALDGYLRWQLELELADVLRGFPGGAVYVSHNRDEVYRMCDTVCVLDRGRSDAKVGVRALFAAPTTLAAALISGCKNVSRARVAGPGLLACEGWGVTLRTALPMPAGVTHAGIRAHYFEAHAAGAGAAGAAGKNAIPCTVERVIDSTFSTIVMARTPGGASLRYECEKDAWAALGDPARLVLVAPPETVMPLVSAGDDGRAGAIAPGDDEKGGAPHA
ncbi:MAG: ATP-binding cassette domain-containing protein [Tractidigestivibacter sp.]|uniref:sulfate/molybdate ABC transporter ATP-binding protein n=1 Tax=Tractidigestivibacter sp. TaxID=2847320 RepID=UPI002A83160B|nr:ATP-binding cassette domain-containing protein [Tractidigestivibacter sp.]MDY4534255.1 ATP-binding cassette domain-containing protein [Tractidigestivibacter sp.]